MQPTKLSIDKKKQKQQKKQQQAPWNPWRYGKAVAKTDWMIREAQKLTKREKERLVRASWNKWKEQRNA